MTDVMEQADGTTVEDCPAVRHDTERAWRAGCRCRRAVELHRRKLDRLRTAEPAVDPETGACLAKLHGTGYAYKSHGCRCHEAVAAEQRRSSSHTRREAEKRGHAYKWRGPESRVSRVSVLLATTGFVKGTTLTERMLAAMTLADRGHRSGTGILTNQEIAERLGYEGSSITTLLRRPERLRQQRAQRRLADVRDKAVRVRRAMERRGDSA